MIKQKRIEHLDSLRGLAALAVVFGHSISSVKCNQNREFIISVTSHSAVIFFFLLSGFVLSRSVDGKVALSKMGIISYIIRRILRLYPMTVIAILFGALVALILKVPPDLGFLSDWLWKQIIHAKSVKDFTGYIKELLMQLQFLNPPLWTIRAEFQCSVALPFLILMGCKKMYRQIILCVCLGLYLVIDNGCHKSSFLFAFYLGHLIHSYHHIVEFINSNISKLLIGLFSLIWMVVASNWFLDTIILFFILSLLVPCRWIGLKKLLNIHPLRFLGKISFSFYALHMPVLFLVCIFLEKNIYKFFIKNSIFSLELVVFVVTVSITLPIAVLTHSLIESPFNKWGHLLSNEFISKYNKLN